MCHGRKTASPQPWLRPCQFPSWRKHVHRYLVIKKKMKKAHPTLGTCPFALCPLPPTPCLLVSLLQYVQHTGSSSPGSMASPCSSICNGSPLASIKLHPFDKWPRPHLPNTPTFSHTTPPTYPRGFLEIKPPSLLTLSPHPGSSQCLPLSSQP
jgi:hypothetical protein